VETGGAEGWQRDPSERHAERWYSDGQPTWLVRDGLSEDEDPLPGMTVQHHPDPVPNPSSQPDPAAPNWAFPARRVSLNVVDSPDVAGASRHVRDHFGVLIIRGLVVFFVVACPVFLVLAGGALVVVGIVLLVAIFWASVQFQKSRIRQTYGASLDDWVSRVGFFDGPFDTSGLPEATGFKRKYGVYSLWGNSFPVRLLMNSQGIVFGPAGAAGIGTPVTVPFSELQSVELVKGSRQRTLVVTPGTANQVGQVVITNRRGRVARFSGIRTTGLQAALEKRGAVPRPPSQEPG
jgi:hypothetical protein